MEPENNPREESQAPPASPAQLSARAWIELDEPFQAQFRKDHPHWFSTAIDDACKFAEAFRDASQRQPSEPEYHVKTSMGVVVPVEDYNLLQRVKTITPEQFARENDEAARKWQQSGGNTSLGNPPWENIPAEYQKFAIECAEVTLQTIRGQEFKLLSERQPPVSEEQLQTAAIKIAARFVPALDEEVAADSVYLAIVAQVLADLRAAFKEEL